MQRQDRGPEGEKAATVSTLVLPPISRVRVSRATRAKPGQSRYGTTLEVIHDSRVLDMSDRIISMEDGRIVS